MGLYAIGDLHLHFQAEVKARGQLTDPAWKDHERLFRQNCEALIGPEDTLLLAGDHSWGKNLEECAADLQYIMDLPGRKILLRGNHDMFWDAKKTPALNARFQGQLAFLQNNYYVYGDYALVGTKGFTFEGPFYLDRKGRLMGWDEQAEAHARRIVERESARLRLSLEAAKGAGYQKLILFLHYPPTNILEKDSPFTALAEAYGVEQVFYAHCHGEARFHDSILGMKNGIRYSLVSGDYLRWRPMKILD
ncbi:MAG: metallophosphoesterase [Clostridia bacterium]|nr:metallophosphoesterase [Clostridia bacterium]